MDSERIMYDVIQASWKSLLNFQFLGIDCVPSSRSRKRARMRTGIDARPTRRHWTWFPDTRSPWLHVQKLQRRTALPSTLSHVFPGLGLHMDLENGSSLLRIFSLSLLFSPPSLFSHRVLRFTSSLKHACSLLFESWNSVLSLR